LNYKILKLLLINNFKDFFFYLNCKGVENLIKMELTTQKGIPRRNREIPENEKVTKWPISLFTLGLRSLEVRLSVNFCFVRGAHVLCPFCLIKAVFNYLWLKVQNFPIN
jgi:hypothetical protein